MKKKRNRIGYCLKLVNKQQKDLAAYLGVTKMCVSRWVNDYNNPYPKHIEKILVFLNRNKPKNLPKFTEDDIIYFG